MSLQPNARLGPYEILASIGAGGMGEVYRATDTRLHREVAVKVSAERFSDRFEREARAVAALNHPNICTVFDVGPNYLVMELVEGETLAERIKQGAIPLDEALGIGRQIADALEAAHEKGIVHRDLKPANIKIKPDGTVKVLDFGLAKMADPVSAPGGNPANSPTLTLEAATQIGAIMGTAGYMAPEQARGKNVDKRADIFAFGVVLYEMLQGGRLFEGETVSDTLAAVLKEEPKLDQVPARIRPLLQRCLEKDPRKRLRDIGDVWLLLENRPVTAAAQPRGAWRAWFVAALFCAGFSALAFFHFRENPPDQRVLRVSVPLPPNATPGYLALSPDGRRLVVWLLSEGKSQLWLRSLDSAQFQPLSGTDLARAPFWSADNRFIGFFADGKLKTIPAAGGPAQTLCGETGLGVGGDWNRDGVILFGSETGPLRRVNAAGGECVPVTKADSTVRQAGPVFLPDGKHFLFSSSRGEESSRGVYIATLDNPDTRKLLSDNTSAIFGSAAPGERYDHLLFLREGNLMTQSFDSRALQMVGDPLPIVGQASTTLSTPQVAASIASDGTLAYIANNLRESQVTWIDRAGKELGKVGPRGDLMNVLLSPDGNTVAIAFRYEGLRLFDLIRGSETRFTPTLAGSVTWSPDGSRIVLTQAGVGLMMKPANGGGQEQTLFKNVDRTLPSDWSRDGRFLIYTQIDAKSNADIWYLPDPEKPDGKPVKFLGTDTMESQGQLSPDGHWIAYVKGESGKPQVYVRPFPSGVGQWRVSTNNGREPRWGRDGKELFFLDFLSPENQLLTVSIQPDGRGGLTVGTPQKLFAFRGPSVVPQANAFAYSPHPDGKRFLVKVGTETVEPTINLITNWRRLATPALER